MFCVWGRSWRRQEGPVLRLRVPFRLMVQKGQKERSCFSCGLHPVPPLFSYSKTSRFISTLSSSLRHLHGTLSSLTFGTPPLVLVPSLTVGTLTASLFYPAPWEFPNFPRIDGNIPSPRPPAPSRPGSLSLPPSLGACRSLGSAWVEVLSRMAACERPACCCCLKLLKGDMLICSYILRTGC